MHAVKTGKTWFFQGAHLKHMYSEELVGVDIEIKIGGIGELACWAPADVMCVACLLSLYKPSEEHWLHTVVHVGVGIWCIIACRFGNICNTSVMMYGTLVMTQARYEKLWESSEPPCCISLCR